MISASAEFLEQEARKLGAQPIFWFTIYHFYHKTGVSTGGEYTEASFSSPDKILADYHGFSSGGWVSDPLAANLGRYPSEAVFSFIYNHPGYTQTVKFRSAPTLEQLAAAAWETVISGDTVSLEAYFQWQVLWEGYRSWTQDTDPPDAFTAYAVDDPGDPDVSYAGPTEFRFDSRTYVMGALFTGEFTIPQSDVESGGHLTIEAPRIPGELVAGDHTLLLNNRHCEGGAPAGRYSPHKESFIFAGETDWFRRKMRIEFGYVRPGSGGKIFDLVTLYEGEIRYWGPQNSLEDAHVVEVQTKDWIAQVLEREIGLPDADGNPQDLFFGEYLAKAEAMSGKGFGVPQKTIGFENGNFDDLSNTFTVGGGSLSLNSTTPLKGNYSARAAVTGASQEAYGIAKIGINGSELLAQFPWRFVSMPASPANDNVTIFKVRNAADGQIVRFFVNSDGKLACTDGATTKETDWAIATHDGIRADISLRVTTGNPGNVSLWVSGDQVLEWDDINLSGVEVKDLILGLIQGATAESWTIDFDDVRLWDTYYDNAYQVFGGPFTEIKSLYVAGMVYSKDTVTKYPEWGLVNFSEVDDEGKHQAVSGEVLLRVVKNDTIHPVDVNLAIIAAVGLDALVNAASYAAAKAALPDDRVGCRFERMTAADALAELNRLCLLNNYVEGGEIFLKPYLGAPPTAAELSVDASEIRDMKPQYNMEESISGVVVKWGRYPQNPDLTYTAGEAGEGEVEELDFSYESPVATESEIMAKQKADWLLKRLKYAEEAFDPLTLSLRGARLQLFDGMELMDPHLFDAARIYETFQKVTNLEPPYQVELRLARFLGEE